MCECVNVSVCVHQKEVRVCVCACGSGNNSISGKRCRSAPVLHYNTRISATMRYYSDYYHDH